MKFLIPFTLSFFFLMANASAFCTIKKQVSPHKTFPFSDPKAVATALKGPFKQRLALKYLSAKTPKNKKAIERFFIVGFLLFAVGIILAKTSVGFLDILGALIALACLIFGGLCLLTAIFLSIMN